MRQYGGLAKTQKTTITQLTAEINSPKATAKFVRAASHQLDLAAQTYDALQNFIQQERSGTTVLTSTAPPAAVKSSAPTYALAGALVGMVLGMIAAFIWDALDTRLRSSQRIVRALSMPLLASIPSPAASVRSSDRPVSLTPDEPEAEPYRMLAARVDQVCTRARVRTILVTSALASEGKTTTAANLAVALAQFGKAVVLIDGDVVRSTLAESFGLPGTPGLLNLVTGTATLSEVAMPVDLPAGPSSGSLAVVPAGACVGDPAGPLASYGLSAAIDQLREAAEYVVIDSPPLLSTSHGTLLAAKAETLLVIARSDRLTAVAAQHLNQALDAIAAPAMGFVLTAADAVGEYGYGQVGYGYGYREPPSGALHMQLDGALTAITTRVRVARPAEAASILTRLSTRLKALRRSDTG